MQNTEKDSITVPTSMAERQIGNPKSIPELPIRHGIKKSHKNHKTKLIKIEVCTNART